MDEWKSYVEISYIGGGYEKRELEDWGPEYIPQDNNIRKIRFFKTDVEGKMKVKTAWLCYGERITLEEAKRMFANDSKYEILLGNLEYNSKSCSPCLGMDGSLFAIDDEESEITISEYTKNIEASREAISRLGK